VAQPSPCALSISPMAAGGASRTSAFAIIVVAPAVAGRPCSQQQLAAGSHVVWR
jgi:hypothetical protein